MELLDRVLSSWGMTLRGALLVVVVLAGVAVVGAALGIAGPVLLGLVLYELKRGRRAAARSICEDGAHGAVADW